MAGFSCYRDDYEVRSQIYDPSGVALTYGDIVKLLNAESELLAACEALLNAPMMTDRTHDKVRAAHQQAREAIAKAKGGAR